ncbi:MAG: hypothetical protein SGCHY_001769 [Lobulomycetales sp.]
MVFVRDLLSLLDTKLNTHFTCILCEKTFASGVMLRSHQRKKKHFKLNPANENYDRFYICNYILDGDGNDDDDDVCSLATSCAADFIDEFNNSASTRFSEPGLSSHFLGNLKLSPSPLPPPHHHPTEFLDNNCSSQLDIKSNLVDSKSNQIANSKFSKSNVDSEFSKFSKSNVDSKFSKFNESNQPVNSEILPNSEFSDWNTSCNQPTFCLFEPIQFQSADDALEHLKSSHGLDLVSLLEALDPRDDYSPIRFVNYARYQTDRGACINCPAVFKDSAALVRHYKDTRHASYIPPAAAGVWKDPNFLFPWRDGDPMLWSL